MERSVLCFRAIKDFVADLYDLHKASNPTQLGNFHKILQSIEETNQESMKRVENSFKFFFENNYDIFKTGDLLKLEQTTRIEYSPRVYILIQKYYYKSDSDSRRDILKHLNAIHAIINPTDENIGKLKQPKLIEGDSEEANFLNGILQSSEETFKNMGPLDMSNPTAMIAQMMKSGMAGNFMNMLKDGMSGKKKLNIKKLMRTLNQAIEKMVPDDSDDSDKEEQTKEPNSTTSTNNDSKESDDEQVPELVSAN